MNPLRKKFGAEFFKGITEAAGVYFMLDARGKVLYIGKAKNLRNRVTSYSRLTPKHAPDHILEMIGYVHQIQWYVCESEAEAFKRENELLHAVRPPFNIAHTEEFHYLFIGVKEGKPRGNSHLNKGLIRLDFQLSNHDWIQEDGYQLYGCFKHRKMAKRGYSALLRLIYAATFERKRFSFPAKMARPSPPWTCTLDFPKLWRSPLHDFLNGSCFEFLNLLFNRLLENESIPGFVRPSIQDDIEEVKKFFELGLLDLFQMKVKNEVQSSFVTQQQMNQLILLGYL